jgi:PAS domain S-box-containing protein
VTQPRILIVEDEVIVARNIASRLRELGYVVPTIAASGEEALRRAAELRPDLVLMDIKLRGAMDGIAAAGEIRDQLDIPVVYLTGYADPKTLERAKVTEPFGYILKPFEVRELQSTVEMALYKHALDRRLRLLSAALEAAANAIVITDGMGAIVWANAAFTRLTGYEVAEAMGQNTRLLKSGVHHAEFYAHMWETITAGRIWRGELINRRKDGSLYTEEMTITPVRTGQGAITHYVAVKQDITARKEAEEELRRAKAAAESANRAKSTFLTNMGHEFRTPLNAIIGYSELVEEQLRDEGSTECVADLQHIREAGHQLLALINDILVLSKIEAGRMKLDMIPFEITDLVAEVAQVVAPQAERQGNIVTVNCTEGIGNMRTDRDKLYQLLCRLGDNAAKFTQAGQITFSAEREAADAGDWIVFRVSDTGIGIPSEHLAELFVPFHQVDPSVTRRYGGTGLGLALVHRLGTLMGGEISVESAVGKGSVFAVRLPAGVSGDRRSVTGDPNLQTAGNW